MAVKKDKVEGIELSASDNFLANISKFFGKDSGIVVDDFENIKVDKFSTGSLALDIRLDGGIPRGKMAEIFGINQSGKSSLCFEAASNFQKKYKGEPVMLIDLEDTFEPNYIKSLGVDISSNFFLMKPKTGEDAYELMINFAKNFKGGLIILDSVSLLLPAKEEEGDMGAYQMGSAARLNSQGLRKLFPHTSKNNTTVLFINQIRDSFDMYKPVATSGGKSLPFYTRTRLQMSKVKGEEEVSNGCNIKLEKATYGQEGVKLSTFRLLKGKFDVLREIIEIGSEIGLIQKSGSWFSYGESKIGQGFTSVKLLLEDNPELAEELEMKIRNHFNI